MGFGKDRKKTMNEIERVLGGSERFHKSMIGLCEWNVWDTSNLLKSINQVVFFAFDTYKVNFIIRNCRNFDTL